MIEHYKAALNGFPAHSVTIIKYGASSYDPTTGVMTSAEVEYNGITCRISKYTAREIANSSGLIKLKDKKFIFLTDVFPVSISDRIKIVYGGEIYDAVRSTMDMSESLVFAQART